MEMQQVFFFGESLEEDSPVRTTNFKWYWNQLEKACRSAALIFAADAQIVLTDGNAVY